MMEVNRLLSDELSYELSIRGITAGSNVKEKRVLLREVLQRERTSQSTSRGVEYTSSSDSKELNICSIKLDELSGRIEDFDNNNRENEYKSIKTRLHHIQGRLGRFTSSDSENIASKEHLCKFCDELIQLLNNTYTAACEVELIPTEVNYSNSTGNHSNINALSNVVANNSNQRVDNTLSGVQLNRRVSFSNITDSHRVSSSPLLIDLNENQASSSHTGSRSDYLNANDQSGGDNTAPENHSVHIALDNPIPTQDHLSAVIGGFLNKLSEISLKNVCSCSHPSKNIMNNWNLFYDGTNMSLSCFLERIEELRRSRGLSKDQLLKSISEILKHEALNWYRSVQEHVQDWDDLVVKMKRTFQPSDYDRELWKQLEKRTQHPDEKIVFYIATMQNYFNKFNLKPSESDKVNFLKRNVLPYLQTALALKVVGTYSQIRTVRELTEICQTLEEAHISASNYLPPPQNSRYTIEPGLAYRRQIQPRVAEISGPLNDEPHILHSPISEPQNFAIQSYSNVMDPSTNIVEGLPTSNQLNAIMNDSRLKCWNCGQAGHRQNECKESLKLHCFRCGKPGFTIRACPSCSGNGRPSQ